MQKKAVHPAAQSLLTLSFPNCSYEPLYNGNIAETQWRTASDNIRRKYGYSYDDQNRLTDAWYSIPSSPVQGSYNEHLTYDSNGNILSLQRFGEVEEASLMIMIDDLEYEYTSIGSAQVPGNKLINVTDHEAHPAGFDDSNIHTESSRDDFEYDAYGNLTLDRNKRINEITYNHLNLPKKIFFEEQGEITYLYDATGVKLKKTVDDYQTATETQTHYMDGFQYTDDHLDFFPHAEGYVNVLEYSEINYVYTYKDHLGNIRLRYALDPGTNEPAILEEDHYYPFGLKHNGYNNEHEVFEKETQEGVVLVPVTSFLEDRFKYKFGGKELQSEFGIEMYDFGARNYDPALGRWMNIDPLAEQGRRWSPYVYAFNSPMYFIDPDGMWPKPRPIGPINLLGMAKALYNAVSGNSSGSSSSRSSSGSGSKGSNSGGYGGMKLSNEKGGATGDQGLIRQADRTSGADIPWVEVPDIGTTGFGPGGTRGGKTKGDGKTNATKNTTNAAKKFGDGVEAGEKVSTLIQTGDSVAEGIESLSSEGNDSEPDVTLTVDHGNYKATSTVPVSESQGVKDSIREADKGKKVTINRQDDEL